jgi:predicted ATPase/class 3 adenylate cyclase
MSGGPSTTLTFLFTDIEGSTRQWEESPEMGERVGRHFDVLRSAVERRGGEVFATMGDGIAAAFTSAESAVQAAVAAQAGMSSSGLAVRMGIHTGEVERVGGDLRGRALNRAARITAVGHGGQILVSDISAALLRAGRLRVELGDLGLQQLRDLDDPEHLWQVVHPNLARQFPPLRGVDRWTGADNLPVIRSTLVGRQHDVAQLVELLKRHRIVTLTGVAGVGKTRVALQAATEVLSQFWQVCFVDLTGVAGADDVADAVALTLGAASVDEPLSVATALLTGEPILLVVDGCGPVLTSAAAVVGALSARCPLLSVIVTSSEPLGIDGEHVVAVPPLDPTTGAAELFRQRAAAAAGGGNPGIVRRSTVEHLCGRLDGIPLAIELAAARVVALGTEAVADELDDRLSLQRRGRRRAVDRQGIVRTVVAWSHRLLPTEQQQLLHWLAVFPDGFELGAADHVAATLRIGGPPASEQLAAWARWGLVCSDPQPYGMRYRFPGPVRALALELLDQQGEVVAARTAVAEWVASITDVPFDDPCSAAVERRAIRLERDAEAWRDAVLLAGALHAPDLATRLCGPPTALFLFGRRDLAGAVRPLLDLRCDDPRQRRAVLCSVMVSAAGATDRAQMQVWTEELLSIEAVERTGMGALMQWLSSAWDGDVAASVGICARAALDPLHPRSIRDLLVGIATLDHFSRGEAEEDPYSLIDQALEVADRSPVDMSRVLCLLGAAWGLAKTQPDRALELVRRALDDIADVPALTRLTLPGCAARLLARLEPRVAARGLLQQLDATPVRGSFVDRIPVLYATALLQRLGHPATARAFAPIPTSSPPGPYLSRTRFVALARQAATTDHVALGGFETSVRSALTDVADAGGDIDALLTPAGGGH